MRKRNKRWPETPEAWQLAVDLAEGALSLVAARQYGLVAGGPKVSVERCEEMLKRGAQLGYTPSPNAVELFVLAHAYGEVSA
jgi:hypothetical protein